MNLKKDNKIEKLNILNEMRSNSMSLHEVRFLTIYLSKINSRKPDTRVVRFSLNDFRKIMNLGRLNINQLSSATDRLLQKIYRTRLESGGYESFQLFKKCRVDKDQADEWYVEIDAHDDALPLFFEFKSRYFTYELWNALRLGSSNQIRMYEILKQYEKFGERTLSTEELRELLYIAKDQYPRFGDFKVRILNTAQQELKEHTDIKFDYELIKKGAKVVKIKFIIKKNEDYIDQLTLEEFIDLQGDYSIFPDDAIDQPEGEEESNPLELYADACDNEFSSDKIQILFDMIVQILPHGSSANIDTDRFDYLRRKYNEMKLQKPNRNRFGYLRTIIKADFDEVTK